MTASEVERAIRDEEIRDDDLLSLPDGKLKAYWEFPRFARFKPATPPSATSRADNTPPRQPAQAEQREVPKPEAPPAPRTPSTQVSREPRATPATPTQHRGEPDSRNASASDTHARAPGRAMSAGDEPHDSDTNAPAPLVQPETDDYRRDGEPIASSEFDAVDRLASLRQIRRRLKSNPRGHTTVEEHLEHHLRSRRRSRANRTSGSPRAEEKEQSSDFDFSPTQVALGADSLLERFLLGPIDDVLGLGPGADRAQLTHAYKRRSKMVEDRYLSSTRPGDKEAADDLLRLFEQAYRTLTTPALAREIDRRRVEARDAGEPPPATRVLLSFMRGSAARALVEARKNGSLPPIDGAEKLAHDDIMEKILAEDRLEKEARRKQREAERSASSVKGAGLANLFGDLTGKNRAAKKKEPVRSDARTTGAVARSSTGASKSATKEASSADERRQKVLLGVLGVVLVLAVLLQFI